MDRRVSRPRPRARLGQEHPTGDKLPEKKPRLLSLRQIMASANTTARAIRFYESERLIEAADRSPGGHRLFSESELEKLKLVLDLRTCGFSIEEIRELVRAKADHGSVQEAAIAIRSLLGKHIEDLKRKITTIERLGRDLTASLTILERCVSCTDPRGANGCSSCEVPVSPVTPEAFRQLWSVRQKA